VPAFLLNGHHDLPVRVEARHQQEDHVVENLFHRRRIVRREPVYQLHGHLRRANLRCMDAAGDGQHQLALAEDLVALGVARRTALEVQLALELLVAFEILQRVRRADLERDERVVLAGLAELAEAHAIGIRRGQLHVLDNPVPAHEFVVGPDLEAQKPVGCLERSRGCGEQRGDRGQNDRGQQCASAYHEASKQPIS